MRLLYDSHDVCMEGKGGEGDQIAIYVVGNILRVKYIELMQEII